MEFDFTLKFKLATNTPVADEFIERLHAVGCDDALLGVGQPGRVAMQFVREAASAQNAIVSALEAVKDAIPDAKLLEVAPDFVGLSDVAEFVGVSRQNMRKLMLTHKDHFPAPFHEGSAALWHLYPVLMWLKGRPGYDIAQSLVDVAYVAMQINQHVLPCYAPYNGSLTANELKAISNFAGGSSG